MTAKREEVQGPTSELLQAVRALGAALDRFDEAAGHALGLGRSDLRALNLLEHGPLSAGELGDRLSLTSGSVTVLIDRLAKAGFVTRHAGTTDRRTVYVHLEPSVYGRFAEIYAPCGQAVADLENSLSPRQRDITRDTMHGLAAAIDGQEHALRTRTHASVGDRTH